MMIIAPAIKWTVEKSGILIVDTEKDQCQLMDCRESAVWELFAQNYALEKAIPMLQAIAGLDRKNAEVLYQESLSKWLQAGYLQLD
jgi:hypothetical protein